MQVSHASTQPWRPDLLHSPISKCVCWNPRIRFTIKFVQCLYLAFAIPEQHGIALIQAAVYRKPFFTTEHSGAATWQEAFQYIVWFSASFPFCPLLNSYFSHLFWPFSVTQELNLVSTWVKVPHLGIFIWLQYLNFPPLCLSSNFLHFLHSLGFNIYTSPLASLQLLAFILLQYLKFPPSAPQQLPAFIWFHMWHPRGLPAISCKPLVSIF